MADDLVLDPQIRDWVLLPIMAVMFFTGLFRHFLTKLTQNPPKFNIDKMHENQTLARARYTRGNAHFLPPLSFRVRSHYFTNKETGRLLSKNKAGAANPLTDPFAMIDMMKGSMTMLISNVLLMGWINTFFQGFVLVKLPFPLTARFKPMLQRGVNLGSLDVSYVSSLSWYFLNLLGLRGVYGLVLGEENTNDEVNMMQNQMQQMGGMAGQQDMKALFNAERDNMRLVQHQWVVDQAETELENYVKQYVK